MDLKPTEILHVALLLDREVKVGRMAYQRNKIYFEYDPDFLDSGFELSPFRLPLESGVKRAEYQPFEGLFGVFNDSLPDGWGRLLLDRALLARGIAYQRLTPLDRLAYVGRHGMGALVYYPEANLEDSGEEFLNLNTLADEVALVLEGESSEVLEELVKLGGSSAGARPKVIVGYHPETRQLIHGTRQLPEGFEPWLIKFASSSDLIDVGRLEYAYSNMARAAGLDMTPTALFPGSKNRAWFGIRRFDRVEGRRLHTHTASGLFQVSHRIPNLDYATLMHAALDLNNHIGEAKKVFRLAAFNVYAHNRDDHGKNFTWLMDTEGTWRFSPAYDLTFSFGPGGEHSTTVLREGRNPGTEELMRTGEMFSIKERKVILEEVREAVSRWETFAREAGVGKDSTRQIAKTLGQIR